MKEKWAKLLAVLQEILNIYQAILTLSRQKKQILIATKSTDLDAVTKQEEVLILQIGKLEALREKYVSEIMAQHGITESSISIGELQKIAGPDVLEKLELFSKEFKIIMAEIVPLNKLNTELIEQALGFVNYNMNILSQISVGPTYAAKGQANEQGPQRKVFDARV